MLIHVAKAPAFNRLLITRVSLEVRVLPHYGRSLAFAPAPVRLGDSDPVVEVARGVNQPQSTPLEGCRERRARNGRVGYFVLPRVRRRGVATTVARLLAEHAFSLGIVRVAAFVNLGNTPSERVLERAGFTREGIVRSLPVPDGRGVDKTLFSLLDGE